MKKFLAIAGVSAGLLFATTASAAVNLVINGDFETAIADPSAPGFDTEYSFRDGSSNLSSDPAHSMYDEGTWTIGNNPHDVHDLWIDQDLGAPDNHVLILNGKVDGLPSEAWSQTFNVTAGEYTYGFDVVNLYGGSGFSNINFDYSIDGGATFIHLAHVLTSSASAGVFQHKHGSFTVGDGTLRVSLRNTLGGAGGNDFGIDNISVAAVPEPASWLMMIMGFGGLGAVLRSNRRRAIAAA